MADYGGDREGLPFIHKFADCFEDLARLKTLLLANESMPNARMASQYAEFKPSATNRRGSEQNHLLQVE
jgi:hypothetical protein